MATSKNTITTSMPEYRDRYTERPNHVVTERKPSYRQTISTPQRVISPAPPDPIHAQIQEDTTAIITKFSGESWTQPKTMPNYTPKAYIDDFLKKTEAVQLIETMKRLNKENASSANVSEKLREMTKIVEEHADKVGKKVRT
jgi:hypothetical protein